MQNLLHSNHIHVTLINSQTIKIFSIYFYNKVFVKYTDRIIYEFYCSISKTETKNDNHTISNWNIRYRFKSIHLKIYANNWYTSIKKLNLRFSLLNII